MKITKADKNFKMVMTELRKYTEKPDDQLITPGLEKDGLCGQAKFAGANGKYFKFLYALFDCA